MKVLATTFIICILIFSVLSIKIEQIQKIKNKDKYLDDIFKNAIITKTSNYLQLTLSDRIVKLLNVADVMQATDYTCGPSSLLSVLSYYQQSDLRQSDLAKMAKTTQQYGTSPQNLLSTIIQLNISAQMKQNLTINDLQFYIRNNKPVIVQIQAWADQGTDYKNDWQDGHYVVLIGYDKDYLYFQDPWILGNIAYIKKNQFNDRWHDIVSGKRKVYNLAIIIHAERKTNSVIIQLQ